MFCSNCGAQLPPNGVCTQCGVPATNMTYNGHMQGRPVTPQQQFYNPNPMYVQYQGPQQGYGQPFVPQENVAIRGIKEPRLVAGIGATIKEGCGSMMMVILALLTTLATVFSFIEMFYMASSTYDSDEAVLSGMVVFSVRVIPFVIFAIGAWMITFQGFASYHKKLYNDNACMHTSGFSTVQAGAIVALIPTSCIAVFMVFISFMLLLVGVAAAGVDEVVFDSTMPMDAFGVTVFILLVTVMLILMIILSSSLISQMAKIKHAIRGRNYENISVLTSVLLFIMAIFQIITLVFAAVEEEVFATILAGVYAIWYAFAGCTFLYIRSKVNSFILRN